MTGLQEHIQQATDFYMSSIPETELIENVWAQFKYIICNAMTKFIPQRQLKSYHDLPWITTDIKRGMRQRQRLYNKAKKEGTDSAWAKYRHKNITFRSKFAKLMPNTHSLLEGSLQTKNPKPFWRYIKSRKQESTGISTIKRRGLLVSDNTQQAEILNEQLSQYFRKKTPLNWVRRWSLLEHARIKHWSDWCGEVIEKFKSRQSLGPRQCT